MTWWVRAHRMQWVIVLAAVLGLSVGVAPTAAIALPSLASGGFAPVPIVGVVPLIVIVVLAVGLHQPPGLTPARPTAVIDTASTVATMALFIGVSVLALPLGGAPEIVVSSTRNLVGYGAIQSCLMSLGCRAAPVGGVLYLLVAGLFGRGPGGVEAWAWPVSTAADARV